MFRCSYSARYRNLSDELVWRRPRLSVWAPRLPCWSVRQKGWAILFNWSEILRQSNSIVDYASDATVFMDGLLDANSSRGANASWTPWLWYPPFRSPCASGRCCSQDSGPIPARNPGSSVKPREWETKGNAQSRGLRDRSVGEDCVSRLDVARVAGSIPSHGLECTFCLGIVHFLFLPSFRTENALP
jgi:hypothetical protein